MTWECVHTSSCPAEISGPAANIKIGSSAAAFNVSLFLFQSVELGSLRCRNGTGQTVSKLCFWYTWMVCQDPCRECSWLLDQYGTVWLQICRVTSSSENSPGQTLISVMGQLQKKTLFSCHNFSYCTKATSRIPFGVNTKSAYFPVLLLLDPLYSDLPHTCSSMYTYEKNQMYVVRKWITSK